MQAYILAGRVDGAGQWTWKWLELDIHRHLKTRPPETSRHRKERPANVHKTHQKEWHEGLSLSTAINYLGDLCSQAITSSLPQFVLRILFLAIAKPMMYSSISSYQASLP
jgi:hypothetical protein